MTANHAEKILEVRGLTKTYGGETKKGAKQPTPTLDVLKASTSTSTAAMWSA